MSIPASRYCAGAPRVPQFGDVVVMRAHAGAWMPYVVLGVSEHGWPYAAPLVWKDASAALRWAGRASLALCCGHGSAPIHPTIGLPLDAPGTWRFPDEVPPGQIDSELPDAETARQLAMSYPRHAAA